MRPVLVSLLLAGCSDYGIEPKPADVAGVSPDLSATPDAIDERGLCADTEQQVTLENVGDGALTITAVSVDGGGWTVDAVPVPLTVGPGQSTVVRLTGSEGAATLVVESDDPDEPVLEIPLFAAPNAAPTVAITSPVDGDILAEDVDTTLAGTVADDTDSPDLLGVTWTSDAGPLSTASAEPDGTTTVDWPAAARASGPQTVTLTATDSCGAVGTATVTVCQDGAYTYDALDLSTWHYEGVAAWDATDGWLQLTDTGTDEVGTAFETSSPVNGDNVELDFLFYIGDGTGADGLSVTALDVDRMTTFLGGTGCGIGYGGDAACTLGPALPGWSIEVDTYYNPEADRDENDHVAFTFDGDVDGYRAYAELPEMEDTGWHHMVVRVLAPHVTVSIDGVDYIDQDIPGYYTFPAYVGFTAGTGGETNDHLIDALQVTDYACD
jgi:hypothetical protein